MTTRLMRVNGVLAQELDGQLLLLRPGGEDVLHLDEIASQVWELLEEPHTLDDLAERLAEAYDVPPEQIARDLQPALSVLRAHGVVVNAP